MVITYNGMLAAELGDVCWQKSWHSNPNGECVELAALPTGEIAMRNSRFPCRPHPALHSGRDHRIPGRSQGWVLLTIYSARRVNLLASSNCYLVGTRRLDDNSLANWYLMTCGITERSRHLLNCHTTPFRKREITWETGPHPARI